MTTLTGQLSLMGWVARTGRSWWQVGYEGGKVLHEWETTQASRDSIRRLVAPLLASGGHTSRWEEIPKKGIRAIRLLCPNGQLAGLETTYDYRVFQLKAGGVAVAQGAGSEMSGPVTRYTDGHLIGCLDGDNGDAVIYYYDLARKKLVGPVRENIVTGIRLFNIGPLDARAREHLGIRL